MINKIILDACCGSRMFWFDRKNPDVLFCDNRVVDKMTVGRGRNARDFEVQPDRVMDFRKMKFKNNSFQLVVFDPPHLAKAGQSSYLAQKYGLLDKENWETDIRQGFTECFRVLKPNGVLIFKWSEVEKKVSDIIKLAPYRPLFGHRSGKSQKTHWLCFMKIDNQKK